VLRALLLVTFWRLALLTAVCLDRAMSAMALSGLQLDNRFVPIVRSRLRGRVYNNKCRFKNLKVALACSRHVNVLIFSRDSGTVCRE
jgi:hypothetical protein